MPSTANQLNDLLQLAAQVGELSDRLKKAEGELASQSAPIGAAKASQDAGLTALAAAVEGIKALNFHVIDKNVSDVRARVTEVAAQLDAAIKELTARADANTKALAQAVDETEQKLAQTDSQRIELARKRDEDAKTLSESIALVANESAKRLSELSDQVQKFAERPGIRPSGAWGAGKTCDKGDLVSLNGSSYISLENGNTEKPSKLSKKWQLIAARGGGGGSSASGTGGGIEEAPIDGTPYVRQDAGWVAETGGTPTNITLSQMADLAQDQFIGRVTASTGVPETATITGAARGVLDDTTVAAMVNTLGGATSTGTGGLVRAASPTLSGTVTVTGTGGAVLNNDSASAGAISSTGGGQFDITAPIQLSGAVRDSAAALGSAGQVLKSNGSGVQTYSNDLGCYALQFSAAPLTTVNDATTYYLGYNNGVALGTTQGRYRVYVPKSGTIKAAEVMSYASTAGSNEDWAWGISVNNGAATTIQTVGTSATLRRWTNTGLSIAVSAGDYLEIVTTTPTWVAANPASLGMMATVYIETTLA